MKSDSITELAKALSKAQGEMEAAKKGSLNPHFKNKYADLADVIDAVREPLCKNGLSFVQFPRTLGEGKLELITLLMHSSGEWIEGGVPLLFSKNDMQGLGGAITYARRFGLSSMVGLSQDDDDGETAAGRGEGKKKPLDAAVHAFEQQMAKTNKEWKMDTNTYSTLTEAMNKAKWTPDRLSSHIASTYKKKSSELSFKEFNEIHDSLLEIAKGIEAL